MRSKVRFAVLGLSTVCSIVLLVLLANCDGGDSGGGGSGSFDAGGGADVNVVGDTGTTGENDGASDDASADGGADGAVPVDEAGCPLSTGPTSTLADAGFPTNGLTLWLRADHGVATTNGGTAVCRWDDQSGNGHSFAPTPNFSTSPTLLPTGLRSHPAISFVGNEELSRGDVIGLGPTSARTVAVYGMATDLTQRFHYFIQGQAGSPGVYVGLDQNTFVTAGNREGVYVANNAFDSNVATANAARSQILSVSSLDVGTPLPGALVYEVDGTVTTLSLTAGSGASESFATANFTSIGSLGVGGETWGGASLGELIVWNRALDETERAAVESHFQAHFPNP